MARMRKYAVIGDYVRVVTPKQFVRCGYPLSIRDIMIRDCREIEADFERVFAALENRTLPEPLPESTQEKLDWIFDFKSTVHSSTSATVHGMLCSAIAAYRLEKENFGGNVRSIVEIDGVFEQGQIWKVVSKKFVKTGTRFSGHVYQDSWTRESDYEPGGLDDEKTHCVYTVERFNRKSKILAAHCEIQAQGERQ